MARHDTVGRHKTRVYTEMGHTNIRYHTTDVVSFNEDEIVLRTGYWRTPTTKLRMNQASNQYGLGFRVYQRDFAWFVDFNGKITPFNEDTLTLDRRDDD